MKYGDIYYITIGINVYIYIWWYVVIYMVNLFYHIYMVNIWWIYGECGENIDLLIYIYIYICDHVVIEFYRSDNSMIKIDISLL